MALVVGYRDDGAHTAEVMRDGFYHTGDVASPDPVRLSVPKAFIAVGGGYVPSEEVARSIFEHSQANLAAYKRIRRLEFAELPKTIAGKIRRVDLRAREVDLREQTERARVENEYWEEDFPDLRTAPTR